MWEEHLRALAEVPAELFSRKTGIRKRWRRRLGFHKPITKLESEVDPNLHLEGDRLRTAMEAWLNETHAPWDLSDSSTEHSWTDSPLIKITVLAAACLVVVSGIILTVSAKKNPDSGAAVSVLAGMPNHLAAFTDEAPDEFELARPVAARFLNATTPEALLAIVRDRERVEPLLRNHYSNNSLEPVAFKKLSLFDAARFGKRTFIRIAIELPDGQTGGLTLEKAEPHYLADWESFVGYSPTNWNSFKENAPNAGKTATIRCYVSQADQYNAPFTDASNWQSMLLQGQNGEFFIGYLNRFDKTAIDMLSKIASSGRNRYEAIVKVRYPAAQWSKHDVEIIDIVQTGWVVWDRQPLKPRFSIAPERHRRNPPPANAP